MWNPFINDKPSSFPLIVFSTNAQYEQEKELLLGWLALARLRWMQKTDNSTSYDDLQWMFDLGQRLASYEPRYTGFYCCRRTASILSRFIDYMELEGERGKYMPEVAVPSYIASIHPRIIEYLKKTKR